MNKMKNETPVGGGEVDCQCCAGNLFLCTKSSGRHGRAGAACITDSKRTGIPFTYHRYRNGRAKETLIKSFLHIAKSDFLSGCTNKPQ